MFRFVNKSIILFIVLYIDDNCYWKLRKVEEFFFIDI